MSAPATSAGALGMGAVLLDAGRYHRRVTRLSLLVELASMLAREVDLDAWLAGTASVAAQ